MLQICSIITNWQYDLQLINNTNDYDFKYTNLCKEIIYNTIYTY